MKPSETAAETEMAFFPLFVDLTGKRCVVAGGGAVASRKIRALLDFHAQVTVFDPEPSEAVRALCPPARLVARGYDDPAALSGAALVIAATNCRALNARLAFDAGSLGIPVNVVDDPALCTFFFPALVRRGDAVAGVSTGGGCPALAGRLRKGIERLWSVDLGEALETLKTARQRLRSENHSAEEVAAELDRLMDRLGIAPVTEAQANREEGTGRAPR
ncbi:MAG: bifunctional precorrin-2 dehydrogenase/sirohydrochlorin ferrochelatase [Spirochaetaceae bacterium]|jgi:siroheme synthase-like protein|nr:bifunctional precorrin-2 dehydrogenase/sirohydrochlorin ferrochelatase [Spirochaetaceae bacterium]